MEQLPEWAPGSIGRVELTVTDADTAQTIGSGDVPVLATPRVLALAETATVLVTSRTLPTGTTTVGSRVELEHKAPTPVGRTVTAVATLTKVDGRKLVFEVEIRDGETVVAEARIERVAVERQRFLEKAFSPFSPGAPSAG